MTARPSYWDLRRSAKVLAAEQMVDLRNGKIPHIGGDTIEAACDAARPDLEFDDRDMLVGLTCRFVVELAFAAEIEAAIAGHAEGG